MKYNPKVTHRMSNITGGKNFYDPFDEKTITEFNILFPSRKDGAFVDKDIDVLNRWGVVFEVVDKDGNIVRRITGC